MSSTSVLDAVVIGAGSAGLGTSQLLSASGIRHRVFERDRIGETWRTQRWGSFSMNTPNWFTVLPGSPYTGENPDGAYSCGQFIQMLEAHAVRHSLPIETDTPVLDLSWDQRNVGRYRLTTPTETVLARNVVIATGNQNQAKLPPIASALPEGPMRMHAADYRNPGSLPPGNVLVVGCATSGMQIAEDLLEGGGRTVYVATSRAGRQARWYRGRDIVYWLEKAGIFDQPPPLPDDTGHILARASLGARRTISLQSLSAQGAVLLGRVTQTDASRIDVADDLEANIRFADDASAAQKRLIDEYIRCEGLAVAEAEPDPAETVVPRLPHPPIRSVDLAEFGIASVIWCTGFDGNFGWARLHGLLDGRGQPIHQRGVSAWPGVYFVGLDFQSLRRSGTVGGIAADADYVVAAIRARG
jgi:putative flavoprotein involved in K+ transport